LILTSGFNPDAAKRITLAPLVEALLLASELEPKAIIAIAVGTREPERSLKGIVLRKYLVKQELAMTW
jgi:hypothetical protein